MNRQLPCQISMYIPNRVGGFLLCTLYRTRKSPSHQCGLLPTTTHPIHDAQLEVYQCVLAMRLFLSLAEEYN